MVCPSECYEAFGLTVAESISFGTPVLGAGIGGILELIRAGETGELYESGNIQELVRSISKLWNDNNQLLHLYSNCNSNEFKVISWYQEEIASMYGFTT